MKTADAITLSDRAIRRESDREPAEPAYSTPRLQAEGAVRDLAQAIRLIERAAQSIVDSDVIAHTKFRDAMPQELDGVAERLGEIAEFVNGYTEYL